MNILVIAHYQGDGSPCATFIHEQVKVLAKKGNEVLVIVPLPIGKRGYLSKSRIASSHEEIDQVEYSYVRYVSISNYGNKSFNTKSAFHSIQTMELNRIREFKPDIIHAHTLFFDSDLGKRLKVILNRKLVVTIHGSDLDIPYRAGKTYEIKKELIGIDKVVTISKKLQRIVEEIDPNMNVETVLNGCNVIGCSPAEKKPHSFLFVGNLIPQKNADIVLEAFVLIKKKYTDANLVIVGKGTEWDKLQRIAKTLGIMNDVVFTGQITNKEVLDYMSISEYFIMPSINEGFGIVYLEAMASGCITIGTIGEGIADFIINGENGFLVHPSANEIMSVVEKCEEDSERKINISKIASEETKSYSWEKNAKMYLTIYKEAMDIDTQV